MNYKYIIGSIIFIIVVVAAALVIKSKTTNDDSYKPNTVVSDQINQINNQPGRTAIVNDSTPTPTPTPNPAATSGNSKAPKVTDCAPPAGYNKTDANGRFKPTIDISNKVAVLQTSMGEIQIQLYDKDAPKTVQNFVCLIERGYYDGITFHRVAHGFVIQAGDPTGTGRGGESIYGAKFEDELYANTDSYKAGYLRGVLAMANAGPNTNGSQFFILLSDANQMLSHSYTIFGKVSSGLATVDKIGTVAITPENGPEDGKPITTILINKATIK